MELEVLGERLFHEKGGLKHRCEQFFGETLEKMLDANGSWCVELTAQRAHCKSRRYASMYPDILTSLDLRKMQGSTLIVR